MKQSVDLQYQSLLNEILTDGTWKQNRTGIRTLSISGAMLNIDMRQGFPILTTKKMAKKASMVETDGFLKGITSKKWFSENGCPFWNHWASPLKVPYANDPETKARMRAEDDLGPIYGYQWRNWTEYDENGKKIVIDQLQRAIDNLKKDPFNRRILINSWHVGQLDQMALVPCHFNYQLLSDGENLDLVWSQRSCDVPVGIPMNILSYATILELIAKETGLKAKSLIGQLADVHIYENQMDGVKIQLARQPIQCRPVITFPGFTSIFDWNYSQHKVEDYQSHEKIEFPIAV